MEGRTLLPPLPSPFLTSRSWLTPIDQNAPKAKLTVDLEIAPRAANAMNELESFRRFLADHFLTATRC